MRVMSNLIVSGYGKSDPLFAVFTRTSFTGAGSDNKKTFIRLGRI